MKLLLYTLVVVENGGNTIHFSITLPVIQPVEAIFRLASPWYSDHKVCATCHVYHLSKEKQQEHVSHVSTCRHNNYASFTLIEYH